MASITVPTPVETTFSVLGGYIYNANSSDAQTLFNGDTDITCDGKFMLYKGVPVFCNIQNNSYYVGYAVKNGQSSLSGNTLFGYSSDKMYIYDFNTFYYIAGHQIITKVDTTVQRSGIIIDKTNAEIFDGFRYYNSDFGFGYRGLMFNHLVNSEYVLDRYLPNEQTTRNGTDFTSSIREESTSDVSYIKLTGATGKQATRMYFFTKFPRHSSNQVLHVDDKYFYMFPINETLYTFTEYNASHVSSSHTQEVYCTLGIDVTAEINAQS